MNFFKEITKEAIGKVFRTIGVILVLGTVDYLELQKIKQKTNAERTERELKEELETKYNYVCFKKVES